MTHILNQIKAYKIKEVSDLKSIKPLPFLKRSKFFGSPTLSMTEYINRPDKSGIIAEFKRRSPSKPNINSYAKVPEITVGYMQAGASALSILTDSHFFGGKKEDLEEARTYNFCPILRKDFIIDPYQIYEAKSMGADSILLIAELLSISQIESFTNIAHDLGLEVLLELHSKDEIDKAYTAVDLIGVNNRDLKTFNVAIQNSIDLIEFLPKDKVLVSESGIHSIDDVQLLRSKGFRGFLIGELFMKTSQPHQTCKTFIHQLNKSYEVITH